MHAVARRLFWEGGAAAADGPHFLPPVCMHLADRTAQFPRLPAGGGAFFLAAGLAVVVAVVAEPAALARPSRHRAEVGVRVRHAVPAVVVKAAAVPARAEGVGGAGGFGGVGAGLGAAPAVRCDKCVASARAARPGVPTVQHTYDINVFTTLRIGEESLVKVTSVTPFAFYFRTRF